MKFLVDQLEYIKIKNLCSPKGTIQGVKMQTTEWEMF